MKCEKCGDYLRHHDYGVTWQCCGCGRVVYFKKDGEIEVPEGCIMVNQWDTEAEPG